MGLDVPYCLHGERTAAVCAKLMEGEEPEMEEGSGKTVNGRIKMDISHDKDDEQTLVEAVDQILTRSTSTEFLGCQGRRFLQATTATTDGTEEGEIEIVELDEEDAALSVIGVDFDDVALSDKGTLYLYSLVCAFWWLTYVSRLD